MRKTECGLLVNNEPYLERQGRLSIIRISVTCSHKRVDSGGPLLDRETNNSRLFNFTKKYEILGGGGGIFLRGGGLSPREEEKRGKVWGEWFCR